MQRALGPPPQNILRVSLIRSTRGLRGSFFLHIASHLMFCHNNADRMHKSQHNLSGLITRDWPVYEYPLDNPKLTVYVKVRHLELNDLCKSMAQKQASPKPKACFAFSTASRSVITLLYAVHRKRLAPTLFRGMPSWINLVGKKKSEQLCGDRHRFY